MALVACGGGAAAARLSVLDDRSRGSGATERAPARFSQRVQWRGRGGTALSDARTRRASFVTLCRSSIARLLRSKRSDWPAVGPLHLPHAHASCNRTSPLCRHSDLLLPSYPAFETRSRRLDGSTRRLRTLTYSTSTMRRRRASHSQRGSRRLRGEVPHRKVEYFTRPRSMEMYILGGNTSPCVYWAGS